jgi:hypothetical protein
VSPFTGTLKKGFFNGLTLTLDMIKVIVPYYLLVELIRYLGFIQAIGELFRPFMRLFGLPGEAALALIAGYTASLYAAIAVVKPLGLSAKDITIIALMLGISHSLPVETPITKRTGVNAWVLLALRITLSFAVGIGTNLLWKLF